jgi:hypothetical protein
MCTIWRRLQIGAVRLKRFWSCNCVPSFKLIDLTKGNRLRRFWSSNNLKEGTRLQLERRFYQTAPICNMRQIVHIYPKLEIKCLRLRYNKSIQSCILSLLMRVSCEEKLVKLRMGNCSICSWQEDGSLFRDC